MTRLILFIGVLLLLFVVRFYSFFNNGTTYTDGQRLTLQTTLLTEPTSSGRFQKLTARLSHGERVFITTGQYPEYHYGDTLQVLGKLGIKQEKGSNIYTMSFPQITVVPSDNIFIKLIAPLRSRIILLFHTSLSQPESSLLVGIVFGIQESMPKDFQKALQQAGVLHVIAASGMNVTMIGGFLAVVFGKVLKRQYALLASIVAIGLYAVLSGLSASIVRAAIMGSLVFAAQIMGRQSLALYGLLLAAAVMLLLSPFLLFDTGFQLSFMATWGLIVFTPFIQEYFNKESKIANLLAETDFSTTFIAQIVTLPILLGTFGTYSPASILANLLVLWMIPLLMIIGGMGTLIGLIIPVLGTWIFYFSLPFLLIFEKIVWFFGSLPISIHIDGLAWPFVVGYYLLLLAVLSRLKQR